MESSEAKGGDSVRVAVNIRPLITTELEIGCSDIITVVPGQPQVQIGSHSFTYDYVYGSKGMAHSRMYDDCVGPLVDALFHGYNATVLAYGQTGSGKTYTMGTNYSGEDGGNDGVIPRVMEGIFRRVEKSKGSAEFLIRVSFIEIFKEEVFDLLDTNSVASCKVEGGPPAKAAAPGRVPIHIRETMNGGITLAGVTEPEVRTKEEMGSYLSRGSSSRATGSTNMNRESSRSHAIFTITMEQKKISHSNGATDDGMGDDILHAKLHLVDLAGSERAKRTGADGMRLKEGIHINKGLLALGNVISALGDEKKRKEGGHVPYRDSKLTRLLQDSLGGNSKTVMIACVSPADTNAEETLNTLKYANRARNIQNKAVINRDPTATQMEIMRNQIEQLQSELIFYRGDGCAPFEEFQILKHKIALLESSNAELQRELQERRITCQHLSQKAMDAEIEKDKLIMTIESARNGKTWDEIDLDSNQNNDMMKSYVSKIQQLEGELLRLQNSNKSKRKRSENCLDYDDDSRLQRELLTCDQEFSSVCDTNCVDIADDDGDDEKEQEHSSLQEKLDRELKELDQKLEEKEAEMKRFANADTSVLKQRYEKKVHELEQEKRLLQKEIEELKHNLAGISSTSDDGAKKLKEEYLQKLNFLEAQVAALKKKQDAQAQLLRQKQKSDESARRLQDEIQRIKSQKVQLQQKIKQESEQFRLWKASREKEVMQLKKEGRRNEYEMHKLLALNQRQKMVLQRKAEEAALATKRLKELLESRKASSREASGAGTKNSIGLQALMQAIEHELEVTVRVHEVRLEYERQIGERAKMAKEVARLKEEARMTQQSNLSDCPQMSPGARNSRIFALENMLASSSNTLISMASQLSDAEERERTFSGKGRWNQVRSLGDAKNIMNYLFNLASSSRCQLRDKEVECKEKESEVRDFKEKVVKLNNLLVQLERQKAELIHQNQMLQNTEAPGGCRYQLRKMDNRRSMLFHDDMDTSDSDNLDISSDYEMEMDPNDQDWVESAKRFTKKRNSKVGKRSGISSYPQDNDESKLHATETLGEEIASAGMKNESRVCCSCSKWSSCKTTKCECRAAGGTCGVSCGCASSKCSNREIAASGTSCSSEEAMVEKNDSLATQGAQLLQSALSEKPIQENDDGKKERKPLSDIGNTNKSNAAKPTQRKKWRKSNIQLVPVPAPPTQTENIEASEKVESSIVGAGLPPKLPRSAKQRNSDSGNLLRDKNSGQAEHSGTDKEMTGVLPPPSRANKARTTDEKENTGR